MRHRFDDLVHHLREDVNKVDDARARALLETSAEVLTGLSTAFTHFEQESEPAWRRWDSRVRRARQQVRERSAPPPPLRVSPAPPRLSAVSRPSRDRHKRGGDGRGRAEPEGG